MNDLWCLLIQAQNSENGIPEVLLKEKEEELKVKSEKNLEKVKFLEKMLGEKESIKKEEEIPQPDTKEVDKEENKEKKSANQKIEVKYARYVPKEKRNPRDDKRTDNKRSHYHDSSRKRSHSYDRRSRSRSRSRNNDKKRRDKYKEDSHRNSFNDERQKNRDRNYKR